VARVIDILGTEIDRNLGLLGCPDVNALDQDFIVRLRAGHPGMQAGYQTL
jgi:isopentenyl diphosphate isomerase/L-lactate dehydrogenase-like FMN-dependent dehydrogenase